MAELARTEDFADSDAEIVSATRRSSAQPSPPSSSATAADSTTASAPARQGSSPSRPSGLSTATPISPTIVQTALAAVPTLLLGFVRSPTDAPQESSPAAWPNRPTAATAREVLVDHGR